MRKIREVLRPQSLGLSQRQIAASCAVGQATVSEYLKAAEAAGLKWPDIADWGEDRLLEAAAPSREKTVVRKQAPEPDYAAIRHELQTNKHVTLQLLWDFGTREKLPTSASQTGPREFELNVGSRPRVMMNHDARGPEETVLDLSPVVPARCSCRKSSTCLPQAGVPSGAAEEDASQLARRQSRLRHRLPDPAA